MKHEEKIAFIQDILTWQTGSNILLHQGCFILNFGYNKPFTFPEIKLVPHLGANLNVGSLGLNSPSKFSIVVIGGKYLEQVDEAHLSPGISLISDLAYDSGMLQSELFTCRSQNLVLAKLPSSGFWRYGQFFK